MKSTLIIILSILCILPFVNAQDLKYFNAEESRFSRNVLKPNDINFEKYKDLRGSEFSFINQTEFRNQMLSIQESALKNATNAEKEIFNKIIPLPIMMIFDKNGKLIMFNYLYMKQYTDDLYIVEPLLNKIYEQIKTIDFSKYTQIEDKDNFEMGLLNFRLNKTE